MGVNNVCNVIAPRSLRILEFRKKFKYYQSVICLLMDFLFSYNAVFYEEYELNENENFFCQKWLRLNANEHLLKDFM